MSCREWNAGVLQLLARHFFAFDSDGGDFARENSSFLGGGPASLQNDKTEKGSERTRRRKGGVGVS